MSLTGTSLIGTSLSEVTSETAPSPRGAGFRAFNPATGAELESFFARATSDEVERAVSLANEAFAVTKRLSGAKKGRFLRAIAARLDDARDELAALAHEETALPLPRLQGEVGRTSGQLRLFAALVEEGSWVDARLDTPDAGRKPLPKPDVRSMLRPLGPVAVFGASNFPLAFSVAGGDTASAFAAGCPVIVKAHPAHPATSLRVGHLIAEAARECEMPEGIFSLLFDDGYEVGLALVRHPLVKAVGFTGSRRGGLALVQAAASRPEPIPVFAEMSSINPVIITEGALRERGEAIAQGLHAAVTLGVGQFCTNPGLVLVPTGEAGDALLASLKTLVAQTSPATMLTGGICAAYGKGIAKLGNAEGITAHVLPAEAGPQARAALFETSAATLIANPELAEEVFGPSTLVVRTQEGAEMLELVQSLEGQLTATLHMAAEEAAQHTELIGALEEKVGRLIFNAYPTGVEVGSAMVHGGPYPSTSDGRSTSVGTRAILRFVRPVCFQDFPDAALPAELQNDNPLGIGRMVDGKWIPPVPDERA
jgi:2,5-dioxopentanoate dehydrogenase